MGCGGLVATLLVVIAIAARARPVDEAPQLYPDRAEPAPRDGWRDDEYTPAALADRVTALPGAPAGHGVRLFAGHVTVDEAAGRALFYLFVESSAAPRTHPLVLWLNGGPGCSSLGGGFLSELGPFYPTPGGQRLVANPHSWNSVANMLFLESPAFVGFSYSNTSADARVGDRRTAADSRIFLLRWLDRFPQYRPHAFWLSGESYAGHYVPTLADAILRGNRGDPDEQPINLKGFLVGNAWSDAGIDNRGATEFWFSHGIVSSEATAGMQATCDFGRVGPLAAQSGAAAGEFVSAAEEPARAPRAPSGGKAAECDAWVDQAMAEMGGINIYDIYADVCLPTPAKAARQLGLMLRDHPAGLSTRPLVSGKYDPCIDSETEAYLNRRDVQRALHANVSGELPGPWQDCTPRIEYSRADLLSSMLPLYRRLLDEERIRMLVYSGDIDAIVPIIGTRRWIKSLGLPLTSPWRAWTSTTGQVGGWAAGHGKLTFASVRGAGHMAPYTQPERSLYLFSKWVHQEPL